MFKYMKLKRLERELEKKEQEISHLQEINDFLMSEINRRDQKIAEQQKRMRFFGIEIGNEEYEPEKLDFPSTIKL